MSKESSSGKTPANDIKATSAEAAESIKDEAMKLGSSARQAGESIARDGAEQARDQITAKSDTVESAVDDIASTLGEHSDTLGHYATEFADTLSTFNDRIKTSSLDELASDARRVARDNPAMFMLGAVTIGAIAARFFRLQLRISRRVRQWIITSVRFQHRHRVRKPAGMDQPPLQHHL